MTPVREIIGASLSEPHIDHDNGPHMGEVCVCVCVCACVHACVHV